MSPAADKIAIIPHGHYQGAYPDEVTREEARARLDLPDEAKVISFVGWVRSYKGVWELYEAFAALDEPDARLVIAGQAVDGAYAARLAAAAKGDERIHLSLGFVPDEDLQLYLRAADVVAAPFLEIFTSGSVLLAMSFERAVIAPRRGCVTDVLDEQGGILYDADDPQGLEGALRVAMDADLEAMGRHNGTDLSRFRLEPSGPSHPGGLRGRAQEARPRRLSEALGLALFTLGLVPLHGGLAAEVDATLAVDLDDHDHDLVADLDHVLDGRDMVVSQLADANEAFLARQDLDEGAEAHDAGDLAQVEPADLDLLGDRLDPLDGLGRLGSGRPQRSRRCRRPRR